MAPKTNVSKTLVKWYGSNGKIVGIDYVSVQEYIVSWN